MSQGDDQTGGKVLVTGASGFLGGRTVSVLSERGYSVNALVRKTSRTSHLNLPNVTIFTGDVADADSMTKAIEGAEYIIHAAADTAGSEAGGKKSTIQGTANILALCKAHKVRKLVYISTCNVYGVADYQNGQIVTEESSLERSPEQRGPYTGAKLTAEKLVTDEMKKGNIPICCLRPGTIYGPGGNLYTPMIGFSLTNKLFAVIGDGSFILPLVYIDNLVDAILTAMMHVNSTGKIYNVVDPFTVTKRDLMERVVKRVYPDSHTVYIPFTIVQMVVYFQEKLFQLLKRKPFLTRYRLLSSQKPVIYDSSRIRGDLSWNPPVSLETAFDNLIKFERNENQ